MVSTAPPGECSPSWRIQPLAQEGWPGAATIRRHCTNLDFYLNHFLLYADTLTPADGVSYVGGFLGDWFIHKAVWSNKTTVKANATSLKKFYGFMAAVERYHDLDADLLEDGWPI